MFWALSQFDHSLTPAERAAVPGVWSNHRAGTAGRSTAIAVPTTAGT
ncbi:MAG: hypothetical protein QOG01_4353 [Pseudonocardiales bacterium]|jgi:hypothetical protein|nr:hypothetical protein [Pseudonocardiales bacterium]